MPLSAAEAVGYFRAAGYVLLDISADHAAAVETLPLIHADPFDRLIVAQALTEPLRLITHDDTVARYSDSIMRV
jgi:PIN domain nuclease of toxin-antitoxin system